MLILTRRLGETIIIENRDSLGDRDIKITVLGVKGNQIRLGIKAPEDIAVHREEIHERIQKEKREGIKHE